MYYLLPGEVDILRVGEVEGCRVGEEERREGDTAPDLLQEDMRGE